MESCILCKSNAVINRQEGASRTIYNCMDCGVFVVSDLAEKEVIKKSCEVAAFLESRKLAKERDTVLISFEKANLDKDYLQLTVAQIVDMFPKTFKERMDMALKNLELMSKFEGDEIKIDDLKMAPLFYVSKVSFEALSFVINAMQKAELINVNYFSGAYFPCGVTISPAGWDRLYELKNGKTTRDIVFACVPRSESDVSRQFQKAVNKLAKECGFHYAGNSTGRAESVMSLELIAGVKSGKVVICDFSEHLSEAYYTAGLAAGLGKICILTCHEASRNKLQIDTKQFSVIFWENQEALYLEILTAVKARL